MQSSKVFRQFSYQRVADQDGTRPARHAVVIIGAGPVGLSLAIDLAQRGITSVVLDDSDRIGDGSRAICFAKRTLEIFDRLGVAAPMLEKGVEWRRGRVFHRERELYNFDLLPESGHKMPAFINLQQYYVEGFLVDRALSCPEIEMRWRNRVAGLSQTRDGVKVEIETPDGRYSLEADWVVACDGAKSATRDLMGLAFVGEQFEDQFLIADVKMTADFPVERWFWFEPPFHSGQSALLHKQPDDVWRIDLQLSADADTEHERRPEVVRPRIEKMLGHSAFELEWVSIYRFQCRRLERFVHDRVIFAGDAAHQVSPFGARGANSGVQDADNLGWKLAEVVGAGAPRSLIASYDAERSEAADENILNSTRSTDFIAPHSAAEHNLRNAALALAGTTDFGKRFVNSGRLSLPTAYRAAALSTRDRDVWRAGPAPGAPIPDAPLTRRDGSSCYLSEVLGRGFSLLLMGGRVMRGAVPPDGVPPDVTVIRVGTGADNAADYCDPEGVVAQRFGAAPDAAYLIRPDGHVAARFHVLDMDELMASLCKAKGG